MTSSSHPAPPAKPIKPAAPLTPLAPPAPSHSNAAPPVTGVLAAPSTRPPPRLTFHPDRIVYDQRIRRGLAPIPVSTEPNVPQAVRNAMQRDLSDVDQAGLRRLYNWLSFNQPDARGPEVEAFISRVYDLLEDDF